LNRSGRPATSNDSRSEPQRHKQTNQSCEGFSLSFLPSIERGRDAWVGVDTHATQKVKVKMVKGRKCRSSEYRVPHEWAKQRTEDRMRRKELSVPSFQLHSGSLDGKGEAKRGAHQLS